MNIGQNNYPAGVTTRDFIDPPPPAQVEQPDIEKMIRAYLDDGDAVSQLVDLHQAVRDGDVEGQNMAICGLVQDMRQYEQSKGWYRKG